VYPSDIRWNQHPFLHLSDEELKSHSKDWAFVVLMFTPPKSGISLEDHLLNQMKWTIECTRIVESKYTVESIQQDGLFLCFLFRKPEDALSGAVDLLQPLQDSFHIGAGFGRGYLFDYYQSIDLIKMKAVLQLGSTGEIQVSPSLYDSSQLPYGVGAFQCSPALAQRSGMKYWILKDYR
jgi:hypothetical protein